MPAKSKGQRRLMGAVYHYKDTGELPKDPGFAAKIKEIADGMSKKSADKFASTKEKGLPNKKKTDEGFQSFRDYLKDNPIT